MANRTLESEELRRIFRDYLKGVPKAKTMKKYGLSETEFWSIIGIYHKPRRAVNNAKVEAKPVAEAPKAKAAPVAKAETETKPVAKVLTKETKS